MEVRGIIENQKRAENLNNSLPKKENNVSFEKPKQSFSQMLDALREAENVSSIVSNVQKDSSKSGSVSGLKTGNFQTPNVQLDTRLPGDILKPMKIETPVPADTHRKVQGMANAYGKSGGAVNSRYEIDRTSKLYEQALEFESYFVKIMLDSMRSTLSGKSLAGDESFAGKMYQDMMYDELGRNMTKNAGFGLADQIYLELSHKR